MIQLHEFLNFLILALSLATVLLTLFSFFVFKIRQIRTMSADSQTVLLESSYFRRYAPHLTQQKADAGSIQKKAHAFLTRRGLAAYAVLVVILLAVFTVHFTLTESSLTVDLEQIAAKQKELREQGLLQAYQPNPALVDQTSDEMITAHQLQALRDRAASLASVQFKVVKLNGNKQAARDWLQFLISIGAQSSQAIDLSDLTKKNGAWQGSVLVLAGTSSLTPKESAAIATALESGASVIASGPLAVYNTDGYAHGRSSVLGHHFGLEFEPRFANLDYDQAFARLALGPASGQSQDLRLKVPSYRSEFRSRVRMGQSWVSLDHSEEAIVHTVVGPKGDRRAWLQFSPNDLTTISNFDQYHWQTAVINVLQWLGRVPRVSPWPWKNGAIGAAGIALTADHPQRLWDSVQMLNEITGAPVPYMTAFLNAGSDSPKFPKKLLESEIDLQLGQLAPKVDLSKFSSAFTGIETSRFTVEAALAKRVSGLFLGEPLNKVTINAAAQNGLSYVIARRSRENLLPSFASGMVSLPSPIINFQTDPIEPAMQQLSAEIRKVVHQNGAFILTLAEKDVTEKTGPQLFPRLLGALGESGAWLASPSDLAHWWKLRDRVSVELAKSENGEWSAVVKNGSEEAIEGLTLFLSADDDLIVSQDAAKARLWRAPAHSPTTSNTEGQLIVVPRLEGQSEQKILLGKTR